MASWPEQMHDPRADIDYFVPHASKVLLINSQDRTDCLQVLFNPTELPRSISVNVGKLEPIGWSSPVLEYGSTGSVDFQLKFWLSAVALSRLKALHSTGGFPSGIGGADEPEVLTELRLSASDKLVDIESQIRWLESFCYSDAPGLAPPPMFVCWPRNMTVLAILKTIQTVVHTFDEWQHPRIAEITADFSELRFGFRSRGQFLKTGVRYIRDEAYDASGGQMTWKPGRAGQSLRTYTGSNGVTMSLGEGWVVVGNVK